MSTSVNVTLRAKVDMEARDLHTLEAAEGLSGDSDSWNGRSG